ncbi:MAG: ATPase P [Desulfobacteraceae bacterium]|nr:ATPase P [Desulfobacteraceae bacterium]
MIKIEVPGLGELALDHLVMDYNGTMACDGKLLDGVASLVESLSRDLAVHVITADTFGEVAKELDGLPVNLHILGRENQDLAKRKYVEKLGAGSVASIGNGRNDGPMLELARIGIALIQEEGASVETLMSADIVCRDIRDALALLLKPQRLIATLRT